MSKVNKWLARTAVAVGGMAAAVPAFATGPDYTSLTSAVDFTTTITAILAVMALLAGLYLVIKGGKVILGVLRGR